MKQANKELMGTLVFLGAVYHIFAMSADWDKVQKNFKTYKTNPSAENLIRLLTADGVFVEDTLQWVV